VAEVSILAKSWFSNPARALKTHFNRSTETPFRAADDCSCSDQSKALTDKAQLFGTYAPLSFLKGNSLHVGFDIGEDLRWLELPNVTRRDGMREKSNTN